MTYSGVRRIARVLRRQFSGPMMMSDKSNTIVACVSNDLMRDIDALRADEALSAFTVTHIRSPSELLELHTCTPFDYLILEDSLEGLTCDTIILPIRGQFDIRPIIVIGAACDAQTVTRFIRAGADDYRVRDDLSLQSLRESMQFARQAERRRKSERDIRQVVSQLRAADNYAQMIVDQSTDMIVAVDLALRITEFNRAAERSFGYKRDEMIGKHVSILYADPDQAWPIRMQTFKSGFIGEVCNRRRNGEEFVSALHACKIVDTAGELIGVLGMSREIITGQSADNRLRAVHQQFLNRTEELNRREFQIVEIERICRQTVSRLIDLAAGCNSHPTAVADVDKVLTVLRSEFNRRPAEADDDRAPGGPRSIQDWYTSWCRSAESREFVSLSAESVPSSELRIDFDRLSETLNRLLDEFSNDPELSVVIAEPRLDTSCRNTSLIVQLTVSTSVDRLQRIRTVFATDPAELLPVQPADLLMDLRLLAVRRFAVASDIEISLEPAPTSSALMLTLTVEDPTYETRECATASTLQTQTSLIG